MSDVLKPRIEQVLLMAGKRAGEAEVFVGSVNDTPVVFEANRLKQLQTNRSMLVGLRIIKDGRLGFATATSLDDIASLVDRAVDISQFGAPARFELPSRQDYPQVSVYDRETETFDVDAMVELGRRGLIEPLRESIASNKPFLGICLGLQLLFDVSYEGGECRGLGVLPGTVVRFALPGTYKVPHMGWNQVL